MDDIEIINEVLNSKILKDKFPQIEYLKVRKGLKNLVILAKYGDDTYVVTIEESNNLKNEILNMFLLSTIEFNPYKINFRRIFNRGR